LPESEKNKSKSTTAVLCFLIIFFTFSRVFAGEDDRWSQYIKNDVRQSGKMVNLNTVLYTSAWLAGMYGLSYYDDQLNRDIKTIYKGNFKQYLDITNELGNARIALPVSVTMTFASLMFDDKKIQDACFTSTESLLITGFLTGVLKKVFGRSRPYKNEGVRRFRPFSKNYSYPSGHTSSAFALVTPFVLYYPGPLTYSLFIFPASTAIARMALDVHWATDVITGGMLGFLVGKLLTDWHQKKESEKNFYLSMPGKYPMLTVSIPLN